SVNSAKRGCRSLRIRVEISLRSLAKAGFCCRYRSFACSTTPAINGLNSAVAPVIVINSLALAKAAGVGCCALASGLKVTRVRPSAAHRAALLMAFATLILLLHLARDSRLFDHPHTFRAANNGRSCETYKETVFNHPRHACKRMRQSRRVVNPAQSCINNPVPAVSDKRMAVLDLSYHQRAGLLDVFYRRLDRSLNGRDTKRNDFDRQWKPAKRIDAFALIGDHNHARRSRSNDFLPEQGATAALDQGKI